MKKILIIIGLLTIAGCQQLMHGQMQPVKLIDVKNNTYFTTCSGAVEDWGSCNQKARDTCAGNYLKVNKYETLKGTVIRELTFQCKK